MLVLEASGCKLVLVQLDLTIVTRRWTNRLREAIGGKLGIDPKAVMVFATQNHAAPGLGDCFVFNDFSYMPDELAWLRGGDDRYNPIVVERATEAAVRANDQLQPVSIGAASGIESRVAFNRRFVMRDGTAATHPANSDPRIRYAEGPIDPEVGIVCLKDAHGETVAALLHYTCHPNHGYPHRFVTADWPGAWANGVRELLGESCVPLVLNGCCGNIHHHNHLDRDHVDSYERMGRLLTETTEGILRHLEFQACDSIAWFTNAIALPWSRQDEEGLRQARDLLARHPEPMWLDEARSAVDWEWVYAVALLDLQITMNRDSAYSYEIQVFRIGDIAIVGLPGEPFVEGQLRIKLNSPTYPTYAVHMTNDCASYIATPEAIERGGYETRPGHASKFAPGALDMIVDTATEILREAFGK